MSHRLPLSAPFEAEPRPALALLAVLNPDAGGCDPERVRQALSDECARSGREIRFRRTPEDGDLGAWLLPKLSGVERVVVAGGDGTLAAVGAAAREAKLPLAIVPVGTANVLARELGIPLELEAACQLAVNGQRLRCIDALQVGERLFFSHVSVGACSRIAESTSSPAKRSFRRVAYLWHGLRRLGARSAWRFRLVVDGLATRVRASSILVANAGSVGAADLRWGPDISPDDGCADVCIVRARTPAEHLRLAWRIATGRQRNAPELCVLRAARSVSISAGRSGRAPAHGDGEAIGHAPLEVGVAPRALQVVVPDL